MPIVMVVVGYGLVSRAMPILMVVAGYGLVSRAMLTVVDVVARCWCETRS